MSYCIPGVIGYACLTQLQLRAGKCVGCWVSTCPAKLELGDKDLPSSHSLPFHLVSLWKRPPAQKWFSCHTGPVNASQRAHLAVSQ